MTHERVKAFRDMGVGSAGMWIYGSFYRPVDFGWARKLIGLATLVEPNPKKQNQPWTYVMTKEPLSGALIEDYELTLIEKGEKND